MADSKLIFKAASKTRFLLFLFLRAGIIVICIVAGGYFTDNPVGISIVFGIGLLFFLAIGDDEIHLYSDKILVLSNSLLFIILRKRSDSYKIQDIKSAYVDDGTPDEQTGETFISIFKYLYVKSPGKSLTILLELKTGETKGIATNLDKDTIKLLVYKINSLAQYKGYNPSN